MELRELIEKELISCLNSLTIATIIASGFIFGLQLGVALLIIFPK